MIMYSMTTIRRVVLFALSLVLNMSVGMTQVNALTSIDMNDSDIRLPENGHSDTGESTLYKPTTLDAIASNREVQLAWSMPGVSAADYFVIERSQDGIHWEALAQPDAIHGEIPNVTYNEVDRSPYVGTSYYRLSAISLDGDRALLDIASAHIYLKGIELYPNPTRDQCSLIFTNESADALIHFRICDLQGREFQSYSVSASNGTNVVTLDTRQLPSGQYLVVPGDNAPFAEPIRLVICD